MSAREWAGRVILAAGDVDLPTYGSPEWEAAPLPVKRASAVRAAEAWRQESDPHVIAARLEAELEHARRYVERDYALWREVAGRVARMAETPTFDELAERRRQVPPGTGTYRGGRRHGAA